MHYVNGIEISLVTEFMVKKLGPAGVCMYYATVTFLGMFFIIFVVKETQGLTDRQKKQLYYPKDSLIKNAQTQGQGAGNVDGETMDISIETFENEEPQVLEEQKHQKLTQDTNREENVVVKSPQKVVNAEVYAQLD